MRVPTLIPVLGWAIVLAACATTDGSTLALYRGTMQSSCAPHDALSTALSLQAEKGGATVSFNLWPAEGVVPPARVEFDERNLVGQAVYCTGPGDCQAAEWGRVDLRASSETAEIEGEWSLGMADGSIIRGRLIADWLAIQALCG